MNRTLPLDKLPKDLLEKLRRANGAFAARYPGDSGARQPVHVVYGGAHRFKAKTPQRMGELALATIRDYAPDAKSFAAAVGLPASSPLIEPVFTRVMDKLQREPVEDFRVDFEDGYGTRPDAEEDGHAVQVASEIARGLKEGTLSPFIGIRIKPLSEEARARSFRTVDIFLTELAQQAGGRFPGLIITLPKVTVPEQVEALAALLELAESQLRIQAGSLPAQIGLVEGDVVGKINGYPMTTVEEALRAYTSLRNESQISVDLTRNGQPVTLSYAIR